MAFLWYTVLLLIGLQLSNGHSWLDCVKDVGTGLRTGVADCKGFARGYPGRVSGVNVDQIMTYRIQPAVMGQNPPICGPGQRTANYSAAYPKAKANAGETLRMRWTPNGHQKGAGQNPLTYSIHWTGKAGTQLNNRLDINDNNKLAGPFPFDETCFCNNCAGDPCYGKFTIPPNTPSGSYSFIWYWIFNRDAASGGEEYTTCFDVDVLATNGVPATSTPTVRTSAKLNASTNPGTSETSHTVVATSAVTSNTTAGAVDLTNTGTTTLCFGLLVFLAVTLLL